MTFRPPSRAFTLVELLLAGSIVAVAFVFSFGIISSCVSALTGIKRHQTAQAITGAALEKVVRDYAQAQGPISSTPTSLGLTTDGRPITWNLSNGHLLRTAGSTQADYGTGFLSLGCSQGIHTRSVALTLMAGGQAVKLEKIYYTWGNTLP